MAFSDDLRVVEEQHARFPDLKKRLVIPHRIGKAGMVTPWIRVGHPLVPLEYRDHGRHFVLIWSTSPSYLKRIDDRVQGESAPSWREDLRELGVYNLPVPAVFITNGFTVDIGMV